jgi:hypothetical protein
MRTVAIGLLLATVSACAAPPAVPPPPDHWLDQGFTVYSDNRTTVNHPAPGLSPRPVPVANLYRGTEGGYVACYTHAMAQGAYRVSPDIAVAGLVRMPGAYSGRVLRPRGYETADISALDQFKTICGQALAACRDGSCWAGGDTGGFVGELGQ